MTEINTSDLIGDPLNWAVARASHGMRTRQIKAGGPVYIERMDGSLDQSPYQPSTDWAQGGPIIERESIGIILRGGSACRKPSWFATPHDQDISTGYEGENFDPTFMVIEATGCYGPTPLIAAMRCYVASKLGYTVDIPEGIGMIKFNDKEYLMGFALHSHSVRVDWKHVGDAYFMNQKCPIYRQGDGPGAPLFIKYQPLNTELPNFHPLRTQADLLFGWS